MMKRPSFQRRPPTGFTFFEILATVSVLGVGMILIYRVLIASLNYQNHLTLRLYAMNLLEHSVSDAERKYNFWKGTGVFTVDPVESVEAVVNNRRMIFQVRYDLGPVGELENILRLDVDVIWPENGRNMHLNRSVFIGRMWTEKS